MRQTLVDRHPSGNGPRTAPCIGIVCDPREEPPQRDGGAQLALFLISPADDRGCGLINAEHATSMTTVALPRKQTRCYPASPAGRCDRSASVPTTSPPALLVGLGPAHQD